MKGELSRKKAQESQELNGKRRLVFILRIFAAGESESEDRLRAVLAFSFLRIDLPGR
jgi:hypothetical protein